MNKIQGLNQLGLFLTLMALLLACGKQHRTPKAPLGLGDGDSFGEGGGGGGGGGSPGTSISFRFVGTPQMVSEGGFDVNIYPEMDVKAEGQLYSLYLTGYGVRKKKKFFWFDVYVAASYITKPVKQMSQAPLNHIAESKVEAMLLTMLRDLSGEDIANSMKDALSVNGINSNDPMFGPIFDQLGAGVSEGDQILLVPYTKPGGTWDRVIAIMPNDRREAAGDSLGWLLWHIWFGKPLDDGIAQLKNKLVGN